MGTVDTRIIAMLPHLTVDQKEEILRRIREMAMFEAHRNAPDKLSTTTKSPNRA